MAMIRTSFAKTENSVKGWKGFIPSSKWEKEVLNDPDIKYRMEVLEDGIMKGDESLLAQSVLAYNQDEPEYDEESFLVGFWDNNPDPDENMGMQSVCCPDNFSIICMAAVMQKKGRELRKLKKLAEKQKEEWYLKEYHNVMNYWKEVKKMK